MPPSRYLAHANQLVATLSAESRAFFLEHCELVDLQRHDVLTEVGQHADHAYFPIDGFVAALLRLENTGDVQVGLIGNEGMINVSLVLGVKAATMSSVVQGNGRAFRIRNHELQKLLRAIPFLRDILHRYIAMRMDQLALNIGCANSHAVEQRLARWLLMAKDRMRSNELFLTHEVLALMLGVRRESVTQAASSLQKHGLISYSRGDLMLLDSTRLEAVACGCYQKHLRMYESAMGTQTS